MKTFGYEIGRDRLIELAEFTIQADPSELRSIASFLEHVAGLMEKHGPAFGHEHYSDWVKDREPGVDFIVHGNAKKATS
jgi:hypothetical protein